MRIGTMNRKALPDVTQSFTLLYRSQSVTVRRRKNAVADSCTPPLPNPLPIRWGEGKEIEHVRPSGIDHRQSSIPSPHRMGRGLGRGATFTLLLRRIPFCRTSRCSGVFDVSDVLLTASRRYGRVKLCVTRCRFMGRLLGNIVFAHCTHEPELGKVDVAAPPRLLFAGCGAPQPYLQVHGEHWRCPRLFASKNLNW